MVREVNFFNSGTHSSRFGTNFECSCFSTFLGSGKFLEFREISENFENVVPETLFSEANISSNICRIEMKSGWLDSLNSEVFA